MENDYINKEEILKRAEKFFKDTIVNNHISNLEKLTSLKNFKYNPFLIKYLANFLTGSANPRSIAKALIYPRILGTSITTSFGQNVQNFCSTVLPGFGSTTSGIDFEFVDQVDQRKKYCQVKAGPQTINKDDIETIDRHFKSIKRLASTNNLKLQIDDLVVGILYGTQKQLSRHYIEISKSYPVLIGEDFWYHLTGDTDFYFDLINTFGDIAESYDGKKKLNKVIDKLAKEIQEVLIEETGI
jgi:hypothetical protein